MIEKTPEEVKDEINSKIPTPLSEYFWELSNDVSWLHIKWSDYRSLFGNNSNTIDLLNDVAPAFFHRLYEIMWESVLLQLCRLTDPHESSGKRNLSIEQLLQSVPDTDCELKRKLEPLIGDAKNKTAFARDWRNRHLAHKDLRHFVAPFEEPLQQASRKKVEDCLEAIRKYMNCFGKHYGLCPVKYEDTIGALGDAESLLAHIAKTCMQVTKDTKKGHKSCLAPCFCLQKQTRS